MSVSSGLSSFQQEKLKYYFDFFDADGDGYLMKNDLPLFMKRILEYTGWEQTSTDAITFYEVHEAFFEVLNEKTRTDKGMELDTGSHDSDTKKTQNAMSELSLTTNETPTESQWWVDVGDWMAIWENLIPGCMGMHNFPVWLRLLPRSLFRVIDVKDDGRLDMDELREFYESLVHLSPEESRRVATKAFNEMTDFGRYPLNAEGYEQVFANFLLGRTPHGPGRYIFGCFEHTAEAKDEYSWISGPPPEDTEMEEAAFQRARQIRRGSDAIRAPLRI